MGSDTLLAEPEGSGRALGLGSWDVLLYRRAALDFTLVVLCRLGESLMILAADGNKRLSDRAGIPSPLKIAGSDFVGLEMILCCARGVAL